MKRLLLILFIGIIGTQINAQDYAILHNGFKIKGKISYVGVSYLDSKEYLTIKPDSTKKTVEFLTGRIASYFRKGLFYIKKYDSFKNSFFFYPSYREGDDKELFEKKIALVICTGKISLYFKKGSYAGTSGYSNPDVYILDLEKEYLYITDIEEVMQKLADSMKDNPTLSEKVKKDLKEKKKRDITLEYLQELIDSYNQWSKEKSDK